MLINKFVRDLFLKKVSISRKVNFKIAYFHFQISPGAAILNNCDVLRLLYCSDTNNFCLITIGPP